MSTESPFKSARLPALPLFVAPDAGTCCGTRAAVRGDIEETWVGRDGSQLLLRPVCPADIARSRSFLRGLSYGARYFRFGRGDFQFAEAELQGLCDPDPHECAEFIVLAQAGGEAVEIAAARYCIEPDGMSCEFALVVTDAWQGSGVGRRLMKALIRHARSRGLKTMYGQILATNTRMLEFAQGLGFGIEASAHGPAVRLVRTALSSATLQA
ncbi:MAG: GNAT family N-acetyltransferase [Azoarcus sp. PHD]|nr:MAG: GNAT family N-acetyltransferase [Azoarcus sp. PHD]